MPCIEVSMPSRAVISARALHPTVYSSSSPHQIILDHPRGRGGFPARVSQLSNTACFSFHPANLIMLLSYLSPLLAPSYTTQSTQVFLIYCHTTYLPSPTDSNLYRLPSFSSQIVEKSLKFHQSLTIGRVCDKKILEKNQRE